MREIKDKKTKELLSWLNKRIEENRTNIESCYKSISTKAYFEGKETAYHSIRKHLITEFGLDNLYCQDESDNWGIQLLFRGLIEGGWKIVLCSCSCGGKYAWMKPRPSGAYEMVGCICHTDIKELYHA